MADMWLVDCANCGQQVMIKSPDDRCYWCKKSATKKEVVMIEQPRPEDPVPPRPRKRNKMWQYFEDYKESIIADYQRLTLDEFYVRWKLTSKTWMKLKAMWALTPKIRGPARRQKPTTGPQTDKNPTGGKKTDTEIIAEQNIEIAYLRGFQAAAIKFFGKNN